MKDIADLIDSIRDYFQENQSALTQFFCCSAPLKKNLAALIRALKEFDEVKYVPDDENDKRREIAVKKIENLLDKCYELMPNNDAGLLDEIRKTLDQYLEYYSKGFRFKYWTGPENPLSDEPPGIEIRINDGRKKALQTGAFPMDFETLVVKNLNYLYQTPSGKRLLETLLQFIQSQYNKKDDNNNSKPDTITIVPIPSTDGNNIVYLKTDDALNSVAKEFLCEGEKFPNRILEALEAAQELLGFGDPYEWLAQQINEFPEFVMNGKPTNQAFLSQEQRITAHDIKDWLMSGNKSKGHLFLSKFPEKIRDHIYFVTIAALSEFAEPSVGSGSVVRWNPSLLHPKNLERPPAIGLGHELIHAYYNALGMQPGAQDSYDATVVLFEYITVGLGLWEKNKISENTLRHEWAAICDTIPKDDPNHMVPGPREYYANEESTKEEEKVDQKNILVIKS